MPTLINFLTNNYAIAALLSSFFAAIAIVLARTLLKEIKSKDLVGLNFLIMAATLVLFSPLFYKFEANYTSMGILMLIAFIDTFANFFYFKTFEENEISTATPILSLAPSFTFIGAFLFLGEKSTLINYGLCILIIILIVAFNIDFKNKLKLKTLKPALISSLLFGISAIPSKYLLSNLSAINAATLYMFRAGFIALFGLLILSLLIR